MVGAYWRTINAGERKKLMVEKVRRLEEVVRACKHRARKKSSSCRKPTA